MRVGIATDHSGFALKEDLNPDSRHLNSGYERRSQRPRDLKKRPLFPSFERGHKN
jgi:hypothetical protein